MADDDAQNALDLLRGGGNSAASRALALLRGGNTGPEVIGTFADNGRVIRNPDGTLQAVSAGGATNDPAAVERIMQGETFAQIGQRRLDEERIAANPVAARVQEFNRGTPFIGSYLDEAVGLVSPQAADNMRATSGAMQRERPGQTMALNTAGAVAYSAPVAIAGAPTVRAVAPASRTGQVATGLAAGSVAGSGEGALYEYGEGRSPDERRERAVRGAQIGGVIGAVTGGAAPLVSEVFKRTVARLSKSDVAVIARQLGISRTAARQVRRALDVGGPDEAIAALQRAGDRAMLADAGPAAQTLLDAASTSGPRAAQMVVGAVRDRTEAETPRLVRMFDNVLGAAKGERELIDAARRQTAAPRSAAYDAAYATPIDYSAGQGRSLEALQGGVPERAVMEANALMRVRGEQSRQIIARVGNDGGVTFDEMPDVRQWHYIAQALDGMAETSDFQGALGGQTPMGSGLQGLSRNIRDRLKAISPAFAEASRQAADTIQQQKNIELGFDLLQDRVRREDVARQIAGQQGGNVSGVREGLRSFLDEQMGRVRRTITNPDAETESAIQALRLFSSPNNQTKLRMVLGQDEAQRLIDEVDSMTTSFELRAAVARNSQTAIRQATQEGINEAAASGPLRTLMAGEPINAAKLLTQAITGEGPEAVALRRQGLYEEIAETLTQTRGARADRALRMIRTAMNGQSQLSERQAEFIAEAVATGALSVDRSVTQSQASPPPR